jgi:apolipoprotein N-acyltransferase
MVAALAPYGCWPLIFVGLVPMVFAQYRLVPRVWCWIPVSLTALVYTLGSYSRSILGPGQGWAIEAFLIVAIVVAPLAVIDRRLSERWKFKWFVLQMPVIWTGLDAIRQNFPLTGTNGYPVYALSNEPKLIQPISVFGISGLELLILVINYALALLVLHLVSGHRLAGLVPGRKLVEWVVPVVAVASVAWGVSGVMIYNSVQASSGATVRVAVVQPGSAYAVVNNVSEPSQAQEAVFEAQLSSMTLQAARRGAQLVVWPEEYLPFNPATAPARDKAWLRGLLRQTHVYLVTGFVDPLSKLATYWVPYSYENQADLISPNDTILATYTKQHQAPYDDDFFRTGTSSPSFKTRIGTIGMEICWDQSFLGPFRYSVLSGANIMAIPSWLAPAVATTQFHDTSIFNAVQTRVPAINTDQAWTSLIVKADGQVVAATNDSSAAGATALLVGDVQLGPRNSPYLTLGNWVGELSIYGTVVIVGYGIVTMISDRRKNRPRLAERALEGEISASE